MYNGRQKEQRLHRRELVAPLHLDRLDRGQRIHALGSEQSLRQGAGCRPMHPYRPLYLSSPNPCQTLQAEPRTSLESQVNTPTRENRAILLIALRKRLLSLRSRCGPGVDFKLVACPEFSFATLDDCEIGLRLDTLSSPKRTYAYLIRRLRNDDRQPGPRINQKWRRSSGTGWRINR